jgi:dTDP-4-dehydrorhamnose 3,5-epimerase-like enzyme
MSSRVLVETLRTHADARGSVFEPLEPDGFAAQRNCHVVLTAPGEIRGNHYHPRGTEVLTVVGPARVRAKEGGEVTDTDVPAGQVMRFTFPPGVAHAIRNTGGAPMLIVAFNTVEHDAANPDVVRDVILEP